MLPVPPPYPECPNASPRQPFAATQGGIQPAADRRRVSPRTTAPVRLLELADETAFLRHMRRECLSSRRRDQALSVLRLQASLPAPDRPGRPDGDAVAAAAHAALPAEWLAECAHWLRSRVRATDEVMRWQGRYFAVFLLGCHAIHAQTVLRRLCDFGSGHDGLVAPLSHLQAQPVARCAFA